MESGKQASVSASDEQERQAVVLCDDLTHEYRSSSSWLPLRGGDVNGVTALRDVDIEVQRGEALGVAGPSGSGKSTLLHLIAGLDTPTKGRIELCGETISELSDRRQTRLRRDHVGFVFQRFYLLPSLSARSNVALPLIELGWPRRKRRQRAQELLEQVGLGDRSGDRPGQLSGGEQQRVAVARALSTDPDVLLADEPTGELDVQTGRDVLSCITEAAEERAVLIASHDENALRITDRLIRLEDGGVEWRHG